MFRIFLNDLSLQGLPSDDTLRNIFTAIADARRNSPNLKRSLYCSRRTGDVHARHGERLIVSLQRLPRDDRVTALGWLGKAGPFLDDDREEVENDLYQLYDQEVTDLGPGEAARQRQRKLEGSLLSFTHSAEPDYSTNHLPIIQGFSDAPIDTVAVPNFTDLEKARAAADAADPEPESWSELLDVSRRRYGRLEIGTFSDEILRPLPFYPAVSRRSLELLRILDMIMAERREDGSLSAAGEELKQNHFVGDKAWFTDESDGNKRDFASSMTFPDPADSSSKIQCFWHGKIKTPQFRIHFEWPVPLMSTRMKVAYIGPKISKR